MANISEGNLSFLQEIVTVAAEDSRGDGRSDEEDETVTPTKVNIDDQVVGDLSDLTFKAMGRKGITRGVVVRLEDGHELEVCTMVVGEKRGLEEDYEEDTKKQRLEDMQQTRHISPSTSVSDPGSSDSLSTEIVEGEVTVDGDEEDSDTDAAVSDHEEEEDDYFPLSGYPLVDRFPDLGCDLAEPECGCCHCDLSDKLGPTTSEPDLVLYSDRTSDTVRSDCRYFTDRQARDTGYNFWEVED